MMTGRKPSDMKPHSHAPARNYVSKVTTMKRLERAKMDSMINRLQPEPGEANAKVNKDFHYGGRESTTMSGLPWKIRDKLEGKVVRKSSSEILAKRKQNENTNFVYAYGNADEYEVDSDEDEPNKAQTGPSNLFGAIPVKPSNEQEDIYYRDWEKNTSDYQLLEHSKNLIHDTKIILEKAGLTRNSNDSDMVPYLGALENMNKQQLNPTTNHDQKEENLAFSGTSTAKKSKARTYSTKPPGSSTLSTGLSKSSKLKKNLRNYEPEPSISTFVPTYNLRPIEVEETIDRHLEEDKHLYKNRKINPQKFLEYARKKKELVEAALQAYDPDSSDFEVSRGISDQTFDDHLEATSEALTLMYGALADQAKLNKPMVEEPNTTFRSSILSANTKPPREFLDTGTTNEKSQTKLSTNSFARKEPKFSSDESGPSKFPVPIALLPSQYNPGKEIMKNSKKAQFPTPKSTHVQNGSAKKNNHGPGGTKITENSESLNSLQPVRGSEISDMNLKEREANPTREAYHKVKHGKAKPEPATTKVGKVRKYAGHGKKN